MQALETRASDLERDSVVKDARAKSLQEAMHLQETKVLSLQQTLAEAGKEAAASRQRANAAEERAVAAEQVGVDRAREAAARLHLENRELTHRLEEAEASKIVRSVVLACFWVDADVTHLPWAVRYMCPCMVPMSVSFTHFLEVAECGWAVQDAMESLRKAEDLEKATRKSLAQVQAELDQATARLKHTTSQYDRQQQDQRKELQQLQCKLQDAEALAGERAMQLSVITDTVEALQVGTDSERDQCVVNLTTQLVACKGRQAGDEKRCRKAEAVSKELQGSYSELELKSDKLEARCRHSEAEAASLKHQLIEVKEELQATCTQLRDLQSLKLKRRDDADRSATARDEAESKAAGLQQALQDATNRHLEEQLSARADAQRSRKHDLSSYLSSMPPPAYINGLHEQMDTLMKERDELTDGTSAFLAFLCQ